MHETKVLILIDALGYELTTKYHFIPEGLTYRKRLKSVLGFSQAALTSIFTGKDPDEHGIWSMYSFATGDSPFGWLKHVPSSISSERLWLRNMIHWKLRHIDGIESYYSLYSIPLTILPYLKLPVVKRLFTEGVRDCKTILDYFREDRIFVRDYRTPEEKAFNDLSDALKSDDADLYILYTAGLDSDLHRYGQQHTKVESHLSWYKDKIEDIVRIRSDIRMVVLGDHGMVDVSEQFDLISMIESLGLKIPDDYIPFYDSTMGRFKVHTDDANEKLLDLLSYLSWGVVLSDTEKRKLGVYFEDGRYGDVIFLANAGSIIIPSYMGKTPVAGMHGYHPDVAEMYSLMLSNFEIDCEDGSIKDVADLITGENGVRMP
jgi:predicted AlkP superfamily pyrophosphatase or phosphodiesterase